MRGLASLRRLGRSNAGVSAVEFALTLPIMILLLAGGYEYGHVIAVNRKVAITTRALADLITHYQSLASSDVSNIMAASAQVMAPYSSSQLQIVISEFYVNASSVGTVVWSQAQNATPLPANQTAVLPAGIGQPGSYLILCSTQYNYMPMFQFVMTNGVTLSDALYMSPRASAQIAYQPS